MTSQDVRNSGLASNVVEESVGGSGFAATELRNPITKSAPVQQIRPTLVSILERVQEWSVSTDAPRAKRLAQWEKVR
jgi:hypothetical protein